MALPRAARAADAKLATAPKSATPNFIVILADDQGYQDMGCFGSPKIKTPNLDQMAKEGMRFTDFYSACSICSPSRAALLTGCYPPRIGLTRVLFPRDPAGLNPQETTIADLLKTRGYATACVGKWHIGHLPKFLPTSQGFDSYFGIPYSNDMTIAKNMTAAKDAKLPDGMTAKSMKTAPEKKNHVPLMRDTEVIEYPCDQSTLTQRYTAEAIKFITASKDKPFFLYMPHTMPHTPLFASPKFKGKSARGLYGDVIEEMDWSVGEIRKTLKALGIDKNTLVIYTSDNGPWLSKGKDGGCAKPLRGAKFDTWDGGMREPTVMSWTGTIPAGTVCKEVASTIDLLPTLAKLAGAKLPEVTIDGKDIYPLLAGTPDAKSPHDAFYFYRHDNLEAVRSGQWKLRKGALYNLRADISESKDVAAKHPDVVKRLKAMMKTFDAKLKANSRPLGGALAAKKPKSKPKNKPKPKPKPKSKKKKSRTAESI
ncbi:MAG: sulfatase [Phycisphaerales bacterium]|nr:sulfatase [Phycisphaerales bacterium]MBT7171964.1 sulfatase [Phycisphaerales bacterium]